MAKKNSADTARPLASRWSAPLDPPGGSVGHPLVCLASTYTFHAQLFETELLPRFLGLKFDETEGVRPFVVEREQALATARVCVLVDADHLDPSQSTLRWDQLPVRVPRGVQHSKITLLLWEHCARLIISSANLTRSGYRRNREIAGVVDFYDHDSSAPRKLALDVVEFLGEVVPWVRASGAAVERLRHVLADARARLRSWRSMPVDFTPRETPRVFFVGGLPRPTRGVARSPLGQLLALWGTRRAAEITVVTPFVGELDGPVDPVVQALLELPRTRDATGHLVVPGHTGEGEPNRMVVGLPRRFLEAWASAWRIDPREVSTYVVPLSRPGEKANRDLHAKALLVTGDGVVMLLCGSSNFSPRGMGVGAANVEANLCYVDGPDEQRGDLYLEDRLPVDWETDLCGDAIWPASADPIDDERSPANPPLPAAFLWAVYDQRSAVLTVAVDPTERLPTEWSLRWPGERSDEAPPLLDHQHLAQPPADGRVPLQLPPSLRGANITGLRLTWRDEDGATWNGTLPVHVESGEHLLPPEEFRSLTATGIVECLLSGLEPAEWVDAQEQRPLIDRSAAAVRELESLRAVDTSGYVLYRTRRLGAALVSLGQRIQRTVRTRDAMMYRLRQDPLGPLMLAQALVREWEGTAKQGGHDPEDASVLLFSLGELTLMLAHVARQLGDTHLRPLFRKTIGEIDNISTDLRARLAPPPNLTSYLDSVKSKLQELLGGAAMETPDAG